MRVTNVEMGETKNGQPYKKMELSNGATVNVFANNDRFDEIEEGLELSEDEFHQKGDYINLTDGERPDGAEDANFGKSENSYDAHQDRKEYSIKLTSTMRMAVDMVKAKVEAEAYDKLSDENLQRQIGQWRNFFYKEWENIAGEEPITPDELPESLRE